MAIGEQNTVDLGIEGEEYVVSFCDYLKSPSSYANKDKIGIIGGGNVACDCALTAKRLGGKNCCICAKEWL